MVRLWSKSGRDFVANPRAAASYNYYMGGVDISDQYRALTTIHQRGLRFWLPLFYFLVDVAVTNALLAARTIFPQSKSQYLRSSRLFKIRLAWNLVLAGLAKMNRSTVYFKPAPPAHVNQASSQGNRSHGYVSKHRNLPMSRQIPGAHSLKRGNGQHAYQCWYCRWRVQRGLQTRKGNSKVGRSRFICNTCGPEYPLCKECFKPFHEDEYPACGSSGSEL